VFVNRPSDINDAGQIAGTFSWSGGSTVPFVWDDGNWTWFPGFGFFQVLSINESGTAVGNQHHRDFFDPPNSSWVLTVSGTTNISNLDPSDSPFAELFPVSDINDRGDMVGAGFLIYPYKGAYVLKKVL
ncbi:MAG: hypothetical protein IAF94_13040, partial [Pirellulaceae bacterium]|nr:hypothetical protein [Pirellulaceae bacterium]